MLAGPRGEGAHAILDTGARVGSRDVADIAAVLLVITDKAHCHRIRDGHVGVGLCFVPRASVTDAVHLHIVARRELRRIRLVGDDAHGARLGTRTVQRTLGSLEDLDALNVIEMHIGGPVDGGHRLLVEIGADTRLRSRVVLVGAAHHPAHVDMRAAGLTVAALPLAARVGNAGRILHIAVQAADIELLELRAAQHLDADRDVLQVLGALLRGDDDLFELRGFGLGRGMYRGHSRGEDRRNGGSERQPAQRVGTIAARATGGVWAARPGGKSATSHDVPLLPSVLIDRRFQKIQSLTKNPALNRAPASGARATPRSAANVPWRP